MPDRDLVRRLMHDAGDETGDPIAAGIALLTAGYGLLTEASDARFAADVMRSVVDGIDRHIGGGGTH